MEHCLLKSSHHGGEGVGGVGKSDQREGGRRSCVRGEGGEGGEGGESHSPPRNAAGEAKWAGLVGSTAESAELGSNWRMTELRERERET